jgi:hypothetical protein
MKSYLDKPSVFKLPKRFSENPSAILFFMFTSGLALSSCVPLGAIDYRYCVA